MIYIYTHTIEITERRKNKKEKILLVMRTLRTYSLNNIPMFTQLVTCSHHVGHYIPSIYLSYIGNLYLFKKCVWLYSWHVAVPGPGIEPDLRRKMPCSYAVGHKRSPEICTS